MNYENCLTRLGLAQVSGGTKTLALSILYLLREESENLYWDTEEDAIEIEVADGTVVVTGKKP